MHSLHVVCVDEAVVVAVDLRWSVSVLKDSIEIGFVRTVKEVVHEGGADHAAISFRLHRFPV
jgi:hypothetical protein